MKKILYIRLSTKNEKYFIIGDESKVGGRDHAYTHKGEENGKTPDYEVYDRIELPLGMRDYDVIKFLKTLSNDVEWDGEADEGKMRTREGFLLKKGHTIDEVDKKISNFLSGHLEFSGALTFKTKQQEECAKSIVRFSQSEEAYFLVNAICRLGKTFAVLYSFMYGNFKTAVFSSWKTESIRQFEKDYFRFFKDAFAVYSVEEFKKLKEDEIAERYIVYGTAQKLSKLDLPKVDALYFDEAHYGDTKNFHEKISSNARKIIYLSGTPQNLINSGVFNESNSYEFTLNDAWRFVKEGIWEEGKDCLLPRVFTPDIKSKIERLLECDEQARASLLKRIENGISFSALFEIDKNGSFVRQQEAELFIKAACDGIMDGLKPYSEDHKEKLLNWIIFLPNGIKMIEKVYELFVKNFGCLANVYCSTGDNLFNGKKYSNDNLYNIINSRMDENSPNYENGKYNIILTYQRFGVGSTFENLQAVMFMNDSDNICSFIQNMMRGSTLNGKKKWFPVFEFNEQRAVIDRCNVIFRDKVSKTSDESDESEYEERFIYCGGLLPIYKASGTGDWVELNLSYDQTILSYKKWNGQQNIFDYNGEEFNKEICDKIAKARPNEATLKSSTVDFEKANKALRKIKKNAGGKKRDETELSQKDIFLALRSLSDYIKTLWVLAGERTFSGFLSYYKSHTDEFESVSGITYDDFDEIKKLFVNKSKIQSMCNSFADSFEEEGRPRSWLHTCSKEYFVKRELCEKMASHFGASLLKNDDEKLCMVGDFDLSYVLGKAPAKSLAIVAHSGTCLIAKKLYGISDTKAIDLFDGSDGSVITNFINLIKNMKIDKVIMNPPYSGSLHLKILEAVTKVCPDTEVVNLSPIGWLQRPFAKKSWKKMFNSMLYLEGRLSIENTISPEESLKFFNIKFETDLGLYHIINGNKNAINYVDYYKTYSKDELDIIKKYASFDNLKAHMEKYNGQKYFVPLRKDAIMQRWWRYELINYLDILIDGKVYSGNYIGKTIVEARAANPHENGRNNGRPTFGVSFNSKEEAINFRDCVKLRSYIYVISLFKKARQFPLEKLPYLGDYTHPWTDQDLYKYFDLTPEEIAIIEAEIK